MSDEELLTLYQAARRLGVRDTKVRSAVDTGKLPVDRSGERFRVKLADVERWLEAETKAEQERAERARLAAEQPSSPVTLPKLPSPWNVGEPDGPPKYPLRRWNGESPSGAT